ncbi:MAG: O-antigen ligase family protein [Planctomycetaceae bacterium]|nr:O-antigen ligase family protein [Planctomycetaceae bacterium]
METLGVVAGIVALVAVAVIFFRGGLMAGCLTVLVAGTCFSVPFYKTEGALPLTADRLLLALLVAQCIIWRRWGLAERQPLGKPEILLAAFLAFLTASTFTHDWQLNGCQPVAWLIVNYMMPAAMYWVARQIRYSERTALLLFGGLALFVVYLAVTSLAEYFKAWWLVYPTYIATTAAEKAEFVGRGRGPLLNPIANGVLLAACFAAALMWWPRLKARTQRSPHPSPLLKGEGTTGFETIANALLRSPHLNPLPKGEGTTGFLPSPARGRGAGGEGSETDANALLRSPHPSPLPEGEGTECRRAIPEGEGTECRRALSIGQLALAAVTLLFLAAFFCTFTRSVWMGGVLVLALTVGLALPWNWRLPLLGGGLAAAVLLTATHWDELLAFKRDEALTADKTAESVELRPILATIAWNMFLDRPLFGCGYYQYKTEHLAYLSDRCSGLPLERGREFIQHNVALSLLTETGLVGLGLFTAMLGFWARNAWRLWRDVALPLWARQTGLLLLCALAAYLLNGMFHDVSVVPMANMTLFFLAGATAALRPLTRAPLGVTP